MPPMPKLQRTLNIEHIRRLVQYLIQCRTVLEVDERFYFFFKNGYIFPREQSIPTMVNAFFNFEKQNYVFAVETWTILSEDEKNRIKQLVTVWVVYRVMIDFPDRFIDMYKHRGIPIDVLNLFRNAFQEGSGVDPEFLRRIPQEVIDTVLPWNRRKHYVTVLAENGFLPMRRYKAVHPELSAALRGSQSLDDPEKDRERIRDLTQRQRFLISDALMRSETARKASMRHSKPSNINTNPSVELVFSNPKLAKDIGSFLGGIKKTRRPRTYNRRKKTVRKN